MPERLSIRGELCWRTRRDVDDESGKERRNYFRKSKVLAIEIQQLLVVHGTNLAPDIAESGALASPGCGLGSEFEASSIKASSRLC